MIAFEDDRQTIAQLVEALRMAQKGFHAWENGHAFDVHGEARDYQRAIDEALREHAAKEGEA